MEGIPNQPKEENLKDSRVGDLSTEQLEKLFEDRRAKERNEKSESRRAEIDASRNKILKDLGEDLSMGEPQSKSWPRGAECIGIYKDGKYVADVVSDSNLTGMPNREFQDKVWDLLNKTESKDNFKLNIGDGVSEVMSSTGIIYNSDRTLILKDESGDLLNIDLYNNGENASADIEKVDGTTLLLRIKEPTGKTIEYTIKSGVFLADSRRVMR